MSRVSALRPLPRDRVDARLPADLCLGRSPRTRDIIGTRYVMKVLHDLGHLSPEEPFLRYRQVADALGKLAVSLQVPVEMLWERIPGWTDADTKDAKDLRQEELDRQMLLAAMGGEGGSGSNLGGIPANVGAPAGPGPAS